MKQGLVWWWLTLSATACQSVSDVIHEIIYGSRQTANVCCTHQIMKTNINTSIFYICWLIIDDWYLPVAYSGICCTGSS